MRTPVQLLDFSSGAFRDAELFDEVTLDHLVEAQRSWRPIVIEATKSMIRRGVDLKQQPGHWHWNWENKVPQLQQFGLTFYGIEYAGQLQGLMKVDLFEARRAHHHAGRGRLAYIDYLEVAPWNLREITAALGQ